MPGDTVTIQMRGEVLDTGSEVEGYIQVRVEGHGPLRVPIQWTHVLREAYNES